MQVKRSGEPAKRDWLNLVFGCERPYRARVLKQVLPAISDAALAAKLVAEVWIDSENVWQNLRVWASVWCMLPDPRATINRHEQKEFAALPEQFPLFQRLWYMGRHEARRAVCPGQSIGSVPNGFRVASLPNTISSPRASVRKRDVPDSAKTAQAQIALSHK